jgi:hypothetical protein
MAKYEEKFRTREGLFASVTDSDFNVDGSGTILRKDSSWKLWYNAMASGVTFAFVWDDPTKIIKCGYPSDADTNNRFTNGIHDRCGLHFNVGLKSVVLLILVIVVLLVSLVSAAYFETNESLTLTISIWTAGVLVVGLWLFQWFAGGWAIFETSNPCSEIRECIDTVLQRAKEVYVCPDGQSRARVMFAIACAFAAGFAAYTLCDMYSLSLRSTATIVFATVVALWAILGYMHGDPVLNPFGMQRCTFENEFVINRPKEPVTYDQWIRDFEPPNAIALLRKSSDTTLSADQEQKLISRFGSSMNYFYITYTSNDAEPQFDPAELTDH